MDKSEQREELCHKSEQREELCHKSEQREELCHRRQDALRATGQHLARECEPHGF